jgi:hypothetical protein
LKSIRSPDPLMLSLVVMVSGVACRRREAERTDQRLGLNLSPAVLTTPDNKHGVERATKEKTRVSSLHADQSGVDAASETACML